MRQYSLQTPSVCGLRHCVSLALLESIFMRPLLPTRSVMPGPRKRTQGDGTRLQSGERSVSTLTTQQSVRIAQNGVSFRGAKSDHATVIHSTILNDVLICLCSTDRVGCRHRGCAGPAR